MTMNDKYLSNVNISHLREAFKDSANVAIDNDFCIVDMKFKRKERTLNFPFRFDGVLLVWCIKGRLSVSINLNDYILRENNLFICVPGNIFRLNEIIGDEEDLHYVCIAMSREFAATQKVDVNKIFSNGLSLLDDPSVELCDKDSIMMADYIELMGNVAQSDLPYRKECIQSLWTSMLYIFAGVLDNRVKNAEPVESTNRSRLLFEQFISLVAKYHGCYRNVGFYADKLCLTPKYLSKLIKNATGKSAPEWIDAYVILEAKNMLKYSNDTIKEIVYKLNFPNQSVFYKFFKARTGMTPSEYRNS
jgi:AraC-like DNA-binding protein